MIHQCCGQDPVEYTMDHPREHGVVGVYYKCSWCETGALVAWASNLDVARALARTNWNMQQDKTLDP